MNPKLEDVRMSRARLFALIDAFEQDLRTVVETYLAPVHGYETLLANDYRLAVERRERDSQDRDEASLVHYLDLRPCFDVLLRNKNDLPHELVGELTANVLQMDILVPIRHRVMHGRPLGMDDPDRALRALAQFTSRHWERTREILKRLRVDASWEPGFQRRTPDLESVLHNLPEPDYDETGFVGRKEEAKRIMDALIRGRESIVTITGEGGIGKTALALDIAYRLLDSAENPFEAILWVSLKTERLTAYGVEELSDAIRGIDETVLALGRGLSDDFSGRIGELAQYLEGIQCLIIVDNLESAQGTEVIELYERLPANVRFLFTSRLGIGQIERRYPLPALSNEESKQLLRKFAAMRGQRSLLALSDRTLDEVLERLRRSPLAIRWYVLSTEAGKPPVDALRSQRELLDFCVKNVFDALAEGSRAVLQILRSLDRSISFDEFAVLTEMSIDELRTSTQELTRGSLVVVEAESAGALGSRLAMTATARAFLPKPERTGAFIEEVLKRERKYRTSLEQNAVAGQRLDPTHVAPRSEADHPATFLLYSAITFAKAGKYATASTYVERARQINPEFSEVYRVNGYIEELEGRYESAIAELQTALTYAKEPWAVAMSSWQLADVIARRIHNASLALPHAREAHTRWPCEDSAFLLGRVLTWTGDYENGQQLLESLLESAEGRHRTIVATAHVDSWSRSAEAQLRNRQYQAASEHAYTGFHNGLGVIDARDRDDRFVDAMCECIVMYLRAAAHGPASSGVERAIGRIGRFIEAESRRIRTSRKRPFLQEALRVALSKGAFSASGRAALAKAEDLLSRLPLASR